MQPGTGLCHIESAWFSRPCKSGLSFPDYYGRNLDALNDCMWEDVAIPDKGSLVLVFRHYDRFANAVQRADARSFAELVLRVFARAVRYDLLFGHRLIIAVQSTIREYASTTWLRYSQIGIHASAGQGPRLVKFALDASSEAFGASDRQL